VSRPAPIGREIWILISASFVIALGFGIVAPALPLFAREFGVSVTAASAIVSLFALMRLVFAPPAGWLVQRWGERPVYLVGLLIVSASTAACAFAANYPQLLIFRSIGGIGSTMFTVSALGLLIRVSPPESRGRVAGLYATSFLAGTIGGPLVGSALVGFGLRVPFFIYAVALVIAALVVFVALKSPAEVVVPAGEEPVTMRLRDAWAQSPYRAALASSFANGWAVFGVRVAVVPLFVVEGLNRSAALSGVVLTVFAVGNALTLFQAGKLSDRRGRKPFLVLGLAVCGVSTIAMGLSENIVVFMVVTFVAGLGSGAINPVQQAAVADIVGSKARGGPVLAAFQMASDVGAVIGPIVAAMLISVSYGVAFGVTGVILVAAAAAWVVVPDTVVRSGRPDPDESADPIRRGDGDRAEG
jgi:MFS family permease